MTINWMAPTAQALIWECQVPTLGSLIKRWISQSRARLLNRTRRRRERARGTRRRRARRLAMQRMAIKTNLLQTPRISHLPNLWMCQMQWKKLLLSRSLKVSPLYQYPWILSAAITTTECLDLTLPDLLCPALIWKYWHLQFLSWVKQCFPKKHFIYGVSEHPIVGTCYSCNWEKIWDGPDK